MRPHALLFLCLALLSSAQALADDKLGYVDMSKAMRDVEDGKRAMGKLKADFELKQKKLDQMQEELKKNKEDFDKRKGMMKPDVKQEKESELQRQLLELQQQYVKLQQELRDLEVDLTREIEGKLRSVIERIGDRDGYSLIMNIGDTVLYHKRHMDITAEVVREYNKQYGGTK